MSLDPVRGHEECGFRPVLVISPENYNKKSGLVLVCPITSQRKGYPFEVNCTVSGVDGVVLVDHVRTLDWQARKFAQISTLDAGLLENVLAKLRALVG